MQTNTSDNYSFPALEPGTYRVSVEHTGFRTGVKEWVALLVNTTVRADLVLRPGAVNESGAWGLRLFRHYGFTERVTR